MQVASRVKNTSGAELTGLQERVDFLEATTVATEVAGRAIAKIEPKTLRPGEIGLFKIRNQVPPEVDDFLLNIAKVRLPGDDKLLIWKVQGAAPKTRKRVKKP